VVKASLAGAHTNGVGEFRGHADEPDQGDQPERHPSGASGDAGAFRAHAEPRSRAEYAADLAQQAVPGRDQRSFVARVGQLTNGTDHRAVNGTADHPDGPERPDDPLEAVRRFEPRRAGLPDLSPDDAAAYIDTRRGERPWLGTASDRSPETQRVIASLDQGGGHGHIRHEGWVTEEMNERRVAYLEDPAQLDPAKRSAGIDGLRQGDQPHRCRQAASRIIDPDAFAVAFARGIERPKVRAALEAPFDPDRKPSPVQLPIGDLLGPDGHQYCTGWQLVPVDGDMNAARRCREVWVATPADKRPSEGREPTARPVETFEGGALVFAFGHNYGDERYEVATMYPRPPKQ
jgi:hypothetical protein